MRRNPLFFSFGENKRLQHIATALLSGGLVVGVILAALEKYLDEVVAAASTNYSTIDYSKITCVSIGPHRLTHEGKDTPDPKLAKSITDILSIKTVLYDASYSECPWDFSINVTSGGLGIHYGAVSPEYSLSVRICERIDDHRVDGDKCLSKNVYVFSTFVRLHDLFRIGLIGLKPETPDMRPITMRANSD